MADDDEDDLYDEDFDFVDDPEDDADDATDVDEVAGRTTRANADREGADDRTDDAADDDEAVDEFDRPEAPPDHVVHIYECKKFKRTIERAFTAEDAEAFASEYNRTAKPYARFAITGKEDAKPKKSID
jgi:hypothetical protein